MTTQATQTTDSGIQEPVVVDESPLTSLVGEGKKFKTTDDLAKGKLESDAFIVKIQGENRELRDIVTKMSDKVDRLEKKQSLFGSRENSNEEESSNSDGTTSSSSQGKPINQTVAGLGEDDVLRLVERREIDNVKKTNVKTVNQALVKEFGAEAKNVVAVKAAELGLPVEYLYNMAESSPQAFFATIGFQPSSNRNATLTSRAQGVNSASTSGTANKTTVRNASYYEGVKKQMGGTKFALDRNLQVQLHKDMMELGDLFD